MSTITIHHIRTIIAVFVLGLLLFLGYTANNSSILKSNIAESAVGDNVSGWVWSENIGWISLGGDSYGVKVDTSNISTGGQGALSGYVWSEYIGWISFNRADTGNPPGAPFQIGLGNASIAQVDWSTGKINGWAKALVARDGWDGWIKFSKDISDPGFEYSTLVNKTTGAITGWAWGSDVVGWIDMTGNSDISGFGGSPTVILPSVCTEASVVASTWSVCTTTAPECMVNVTQGTRTGSCLSGGTFTGLCTVTTCSGGSEIGGVGTCTPPNGKCETGETAVSCPQDCKPQVKQF